eukprot:TRINITY_DN12675_c3_g1_i17.p1 TRINITY_DN12675_c3_g1~~TRINITY_DN12675_c3_g1_i17.p1  ORF type:complete len:459 (+),score=118.70 TRINITY_DN12675_c3_g1_i17:1697-3073(+)
MADKHLPEASHLEQPLRAPKPNTTRIESIQIRHWGSIQVEVRPPSTIAVQKLNADHQVVVHEELAEVKPIKRQFKDTYELKQIFDVEEHEAVRLIIPGRLETHNKNTGEVLVWNKHEEKRHDVIIDLHNQEGRFVGNSKSMEFITAAPTGPKDDGKKVQFRVEQLLIQVDQSKSARPRTSKSIRTKPKPMQANASKSASMKTASTSTSVRRPSSAAARVNAQASRRRQATQAAGPTSPGLTAQRLNTKENKPAASVTVVDEKVTSLPTGSGPAVPEDVVQEAAAAVNVVPCSPTVKLCKYKLDAFNAISNYHSLLVAWMGMTVDPSKLHMVQQADGTQQLDAHEQAQFIDAAYILDEFSTQVLAMMWQETMMSFKTSALSRAAAAAGTCVGCHEPKNDKQVAQALRSPMHGLEPSIPNVLGMSTPADKPIPPFDPSTYTIIKKFAPAADEETMAPTST